MTLSSTQSRIKYSGDGSTVNFSFPYYYLATSDLVVVLVAADGTETVLTETTHYSVSAPSPSGGTVTMVTAPASTEELLIYREVPMTQTFDPEEGGPLPADELEGSADKLTMLVQQLSEALGRAIKLPVSSDYTDLQIPDPEADKYLKWNSAATALENQSLYSSGLIAVTAFWETVLDDLTALASRGTLGFTAAIEALNALTPAANKLPYFTGAAAAALADLTAFARTILDDADAATARATLALGGAIAAGDRGKILAINSAENAFEITSPSSVFARNVIINGDFNHSIRGSSFAAIANNDYHVDRFYYVKTGAMVHTIGRSTDVPTVAQSGHNSRYSLDVDLTTVDSSIAAGDYCAIRYAIEGVDFYPFVGITGTLSFWVKSTKTGTFCVGVKNGAGDRSYVLEYTVNSADTWEKKTLYIPFNYSGGTWDYGLNTGLIISFVLAAGSTYQTTAGAWQNGNYWATANQVNACDNVANIFRLAQIDFKPIAAVTLFDQQSYEQELRAAERYYEEFNDTDNDKLCLGYCDTTNVAMYILQYKTAKRAAPTLTFTANTTFRVREGGATGTPTTIPQNTSAKKDRAYFEHSGGPTLTIGDVCMLEFYTGGKIQIDAEIY
jgi:hypothetical protein